MVAKVSAILEAGRRALPDLMDRLWQIRPSADCEGEARAIARAYAEAPTADFSRSVLTPSAGRLAVSQLPPVSWSDWGTPERVIASLRNEGIAPNWLRQLASTA